MSDRTNDDAGLAPGVKNSHQENIVSYSAAIVVENQHINPEIDLQNGSQLGGIAKPSRTGVLREFSLEARPEMIKSRVKQIIFWIAVRNLIPAGKAKFLINRLGLLEA